MPRSRGGPGSHKDFHHKDAMAHQQNQNINDPPVPPYVPRPFDRVPYKPFDFQILGGHPQHPLPQQPSKWLPKFNGDGAITPSEHINNFQNALFVNQVGEHEDVCMKIFASTFEGKVATWFNNLRNNSITRYDMFE